MWLFEDLAVCIPTGECRWDKNFQGRGQDLQSQTGVPGRGMLWRKWVGLGREKKRQGNKFITVGAGIVPSYHMLTQ